MELTLNNCNEKQREALQKAWYKVKPEFERLFYEYLLTGEFPKF